MKKTFFAVAMFAVFSFYGASVMAGPSCDRKALQAECITNCENDSTLSYCSTICAEDPSGGYAWCDTETAGTDGATEGATCPPAYTVVPPVTEAQAEIIMKSHYCEGMDVSALTVMFMAAGLTQEQIQAQIDAVE